MIERARPDDGVDACRPPMPATKTRERLEPGHGPGGAWRRPPRAADQPAARRPVAVRWAAAARHPALPASYRRRCGARAARGLGRLLRGSDRLGDLVVAPGEAASSRFVRLLGIDRRRRSRPGTCGPSVSCGMPWIEPIALPRPFERLADLARHDPDLVGVALGDLRQHLEVLVGQQRLVGRPVVDRLEDRADRLRLALGPQDARLPVALGAQDQRLPVTLGGQDRGLLLALGGEDRATAACLRR